MKTSGSDPMELREELENDLALAMLIERRHEQKIGSEEARELIETIKAALGAAHPPAQTLNDQFPFH